MQQAFFSLDDYSIPQWSAEPVCEYYFEIIKDGSFVATLPIKKKAFNLIGRVQDLSDIFIDNPSVSRKHAILQFKMDEFTPYLYDLGGQHGTKVNHQKLPKCTFKKLNPFDTVKFGVSSRLFVLRCPHLQEIQATNEQTQSNTFHKVLDENHRELTKKEVKEKYLDMLENDPYLRTQQQSTKFKGKGQEREEDVMDGIDWGISNEYHVYAYRNEKEYQLQPDIIRRLPGLDQVQLNKIAEYEDNLRAYEEIESELNEIANKEKKEYGLEEKQLAKKDKLEKKMVEGIEKLEKAEDWIRVNLFGEENVVAQQVKQKNKDVDTYGDDDFMDRTLTNNKPLQVKVNHNTALTTEDYWQIKQLFICKTTQLRKIQQQLSIQTEKEDKDEKDQLQLFLQQNQQALHAQNQTRNQQRKQDIMQEISEYRKKLSKVLSQEDLLQLQTGKLSTSKSKQQQQETPKARQQPASIGKVLAQLESIKQKHEQLNQEDISIFKYYKDKGKGRNNDDDNDEEALKRRREPEEGRQPQEDIRQERPVFKFPRIEGEEEEEDFQDLTKHL